MEVVVFCDSDLVLECASKNKRFENGSICMASARTSAGIDDELRLVLATGLEA